MRKGRWTSMGRQRKREIVTGTRSIRMGAAGIGTGPEADRSRSRRNSNKKLLKRARTGTDRSRKGIRNRVGTGLEQEQGQEQGGRAAELFGKVTGGKREGLGVGGGKKANAKGDKCGRDLVQRDRMSC
jgi:hypothetical protein